MDSVADHHQPESWKLFVGQIPRAMRLEELVGQFGVFGELLEVFVMKDSRTGMSRGCCFVRFRHRASAERCVAVMHDKVTLAGGSHALQVRYCSSPSSSDAVGGGGEDDNTEHDDDNEESKACNSPRPVAKALDSSSKHELDDDADDEAQRHIPPSASCKLFVGGLSLHTNEAQLRSIFSHYGQVHECIVLRFPNGKSKLSGFVRFTNEHQASLAIQALHTRYMVPGSPRPLSVRVAAPNMPDNKVFVGHLPPTFDERQTERLFNEHGGGGGGGGGVVEVHVMRDMLTGVAKGSAFVKFASRAEAERAISALHGSTLLSPTPLKVAFAVTKQGLPPSPLHPRRPASAARPSPSDQYHHHPYAATYYYPSSTAAAPYAPQSIGYHHHQHASSSSSYQYTTYYPYPHQQQPPPPPH